MLNKSFYKNHIAIVLPFLGAGCIFLLNFYMKSNLDPSKYGVFAGFLLLINTFFLIGSGGVEQLIVRVSTIKNKAIYFNEGVVFFCVILFFAIPFISLLFVRALGLIDLVTVYHYVVVLLVQLLMVLSTLYKLTSKLFYSLFVINFWKVVLFGLFVLSVTQDVVYFSGEFIFFISLLSSVVVLVILRASISFRLVVGGFYLIKTTAIYATSVISIMSYVMFDSMDRFVIKEVFSSSQFGDYFFIFNFIMAPVVIISNYLVSRRIVNYKEFFSLVDLFKDTVMAFFVSIFASMMMVVILVTCIVFGVVAFSIEYYYTIIVVVLLGGVRSSYAFLSMAYSVICSTSTLLITSLSFGALVLLVYLGITASNKSFSLEMCLFLFLILWVLRSFVYVVIIASDLRKLKMIEVDKGGVC